MEYTPQLLHIVGGVVEYIPQIFENIAGIVGKNPQFLQYSLFNPPQSWWTHYTKNLSKNKKKAILKKTKFAKLAISNKVVDVLVPKKQLFLKVRIKKKL